MFGADAVRCVRRGNGGGGGGELDPDFVVVIDTTKGRSDLQTRFRFYRPDVVIDWGDGVIEPFQSTSLIYCSHTYAEHGTYTIRISGSINYVQPGGYLTAITHCISIGDLTKDYQYLFANALNLLSAPADIYSGVTNMSYMFSSAPSFNGDISSWDVSSVTNMSYMFRSASSFNGDLSGWDVSSVTNMIQMFNVATSFNQDLSGWCVTNITSMPSYFAISSALAPEHYPIWGTCP